MGQKATPFFLTKVFAVITHPDIFPGVFFLSVPISAVNRNTFNTYVRREGVKHGEFLTALVLDRPVAVSLALRCFVPVLYALKQGKLIILISLLPLALYQSRMDAGVSHIIIGTGIVSIIYMTVYKWFLCRFSQQKHSSKPPFSQKRYSWQACSEQCIFPLIFTVRGELAILLVIVQMIQSRSPEIIFCIIYNVFFTKVIFSPESPTWKPWCYLLIVGKSFRRSIARAWVGSSSCLSSVSAGVNYARCWGQWVSD